MIGGVIPPHDDTPTNLVHHHLNPYFDRHVNTSTHIYYGGLVWNQPLQYQWVEVDTWASKQVTVALLLHVPCTTLHTYPPHACLETNNSWFVRDLQMDHTPNM